MFWFTVFLILVALAFDFLNGFHDAANSIATVVSTRVLSPRVAVIWAAFFNFVAAFTFGTAVARTMGEGMIRLEAVNLYVILAGLFGAIVWDILTWYYGLPISSSHALIGGYAGAAVAKGGWKVIIPGGWTKTLLFMAISPILGMVLGAGLMIAVYWLFRNFSPLRVDRYFRKLQLLSAAAYSFGHGTNDAQKTMGIIAGALFTAGIIDHFYIPYWVVLMAYTAIGLGTLSGDGDEDYPTETGGGILCRDRSRHLSLGICIRRHSSFNHSYHCRSHHGCRQRPATHRRPLGDGKADCLGVGADHSRLCPHLLRVLPFAAPLLPLGLRSTRL
jgi:phosphate/sulfate permease